MNPAYFKYELIDRYLNKELSSAELDEFLSRLNTDQELAETVELQQLAHEYILDKEMIELKERMKSDLDGRSTQSPLKNILFSASVIAILAGCIYHFWNESKDSSLRKTEIPSAIKINQKVTVPLSEDTASRDSTGNTSKTMYIQSNASNIHGTSATEERLTETNGNLFYAPEPSFQDAIIENKKTIIPVVENKAISICEKKIIEATITVNSTCEGKANGSIVIDNNSIRGGQEPYLISFNHRNYSKENEFVHLASGRYLITIKDVNNCIHSFEKEIEEIACKKMVDDAFNPSMGETWKFPIEENRKATTLQLYSEQGIAIFHTDLNSENINEWEGKDNNGNNLPSGLYHFIIKYDNGEIEKGRITILK